MLSFQINADHPSLAGHFPNKPVIPGVVLLDHILQHLTQQDKRIVSLSQIKFTALAPIEKPLTLSWVEKSNNQLTFTLTHDDQVCVKGRLNREP